MDKAWFDKRIFFDVFKYGYLDLFEYYEKFNINNNYIKNIFFYSFSWHLKRFLGHEELWGILNKQEKTKYLSIIKECFKYIKIEDIENIDIGGRSLFKKLGMIHLFKKGKPNKNNLYVEYFDKAKKEIKVSYYCCGLDFEMFSINGKDILPSYSKTVVHKFFDDEFLLERIFWISISNEGDFSFKNGNLDLDICIRGKNYGTNLHVSEIKNALSFDKYSIGSEKYNGSWLFMDRIEYADDNAEHLYRYIMNNRLRNKIFFVLDKNSSDWARLYDEGFSLLEYGSKNHEIALRSCSVIISSHAGFEQIDYFRDGSLKFKKFVFLQHGVTKDDLHKWLNGKKIDLFVTTTQPEYNSIVNNDYNYRFTKKEVKFLGFPRFDYLFNHIGEAENYILVTPTWRSYLDENSFDESVYKKYWFSFLFSEKLSDLCLKYNYRVIIQPHPNIRKFVTRKEISPYISFSSGEKYQDLFIKSKILITDYSSTAFDMAYMNKAVLYYQFDEKEFFSGVHTYQKGYFDYRKDGFGPVSTNTDELLLQLEELMKIGKVSEVYKNRIDETFTLRDSNNCERCFNAICNLFGYQNTDEQ